MQIKEHLNQLQCEHLHQNQMEKCNRSIKMLQTQQNQMEKSAASSIDNNGMDVSRGTKKRNGHAVHPGPTNKGSSEFTVHIQVSQAFLSFSLKSQTPKMSRNTLLLLKLKLKHYIGQDD